MWTPSSGSRFRRGVDMPVAVSLLTALLLLSVSLTVRAQTEPTELGRNARAVANGQRGLEAFRQGDWATAYSRFHDAETFAHSPVFLLYMARARARLGASAEALDLYTRVARERLGDGVPDSWRSAVEQATQEGSELRARLAREGARRSRPRTDDAAPEVAAPGASRPAAFVAGAIGVAGLAVGAVTGIVAWVKLNELEQRCGPNGCDPSEKPALERVETLSRIADVGFVVGGTGLATSAVFFWAVPAASRGTSVPIRAGLSARLRF
jgi:hypothetical protein